MTFGSNDRIWLVLDYVAGGMFGYTSLAGTFEFSLEFPDYLGPLSFFVFFPSVTWLPVPYLFFVHRPLLSKKKS